MHGFDLTRHFYKTSSFFCLKVFLKGHCLRLPMQNRWVAVGFSQGSGCQVCPGLSQLAAGVPVAVCGKWFLGKTGGGDFGASGGWEEVMKLMMMMMMKLTIMLRTGVNLL